MIENIGANWNTSWQFQWQRQKIFHHKISLYISFLLCIFFIGFFGLDNVSSSKQWSMSGWELPWVLQKEALPWKIWIQNFNLSVDRTKSLECLTLYIRECKWTFGIQTEKWEVRRDIHRFIGYFDMLNGRQVSMNQLLCPRSTSMTDRNRFAVWHWFSKVQYHWKEPLHESKSHTFECFSMKKFSSGPWCDRIRQKPHNHGMLSYFHHVTITRLLHNDSTTTCNGRAMLLQQWCCRCKLHCFTYLTHLMAQKVSIITLKSCKNHMKIIQCLILQATISINCSRSIFQHPEMSYQYHLMLLYFLMFLKLLSGSFYCRSLPKDFEHVQISFLVTWTLDFSKNCTLINGEIKLLVI